jgi:hypothetical protein
MLKFIPDDKEEKEKEWKLYDFKGDGVAMVFKI